MRKLFSAFCAAAMALSTGMPGMAVPAMAAPNHVAAPAQPDGQVIDVRDRGRGRYYGGGQRRYYRDYPRGARRGHYLNRYGDGYPSRRYYKGYRGYRHYRPGYRYYNDWWFPAGAFIAGAVIGSTLVAPPPPPVYRARGLNQAHVDWCFGRYRSYRAYDNSFQPYDGPRRQCRSPYY